MIGFSFACCVDIHIPKFKIYVNSSYDQQNFNSGETPFGFNSLKVALAGHHRKPNKMYVKAHSNGTVDCRDTNFGAELVCDVVQVKPNTVAFRSRFGKYLSGSPVC